MSELKVRTLEGKITRYYSDVSPPMGFVQMNGDINPPGPFRLRKGVSLPVGISVNVVALVYVHKNGSYGSTCVYGIRTKDGNVCYDLAQDHSSIIPCMDEKETRKFPEAERLLYQK